MKSKPKKVIEAISCPECEEKMQLIRGDYGSYFPKSRWYWKCLNCALTILYQEK